MPFVFDATLKELVGLGTADFAAFLRLRADRPAHLLNVDLSTLSAATDVALAFGEPLEEIADLNFQVGPDPRLPERGLLYNAALRHRHGVPVRSVFILLRPRADHPNITGQLAYGDGDCRVEFRYQVVRAWQMPVESYLRGGPGLAPLSVLGSLPEGRDEAGAIHDIVGRIEARLLAELPQERAARLMTATYNLTSLRVERNLLPDIFRGVGLMKAAYDELLEEGGIKQTHKILLRLGRSRFGPTPAETEAAIRAINDLDRLDRMSDAILTVRGWEELLRVE